MKNSFKNLFHCQIGMLCQNINFPIEGFMMHWVLWSAHQTRLKWLVWADQAWLGVLVYLATHILMLQSNRVVPSRAEWCWYQNAPDVYSAKDLPPSRPQHRNAHLCEKKIIEYLDRCETSVTPSNSAWDCDMATNGYHWFLWHSYSMTKITIFVQIKWCIGGSTLADARRTPPLRVQILSFWHTKFSKHNRLGSSPPPPRGPRPPWEILDPPLRSLL